MNLFLKFLIRLDPIFIAWFLYQQKKEKNQMERGLSVEITLRFFVFKLQIKM